MCENLLFQFLNDALATFQRIRLGFVKSHLQIFNVLLESFSQFLNIDRVILISNVKFTHSDENDKK